MSISQKIRTVRRYTDQHLGVRLTEFWLTAKEADELKAEAFGVPMVKMTPDDPYYGKFQFDGLDIKIIGKDDRQCHHIRTTHFRDVNEIYCHDCRTIVGTGEPETHKRNSTI